LNASNSPLFAPARKASSSRAAAAWSFKTSSTSAEEKASGSALLRQYLYFGTSKPSKMPLFAPAAAHFMVPSIEHCYQGTILLASLMQKQVK
jgi:hypothetical protein